MKSPQYLRLLVTVCLWTAVVSFAQQKPDAGPAPEQIADPYLRQILPAPRLRLGALDSGWQDRHLRLMQDVALAKASGPVTVLFAGDSITDNFHKTGPAPDQEFKSIWDELFAPHGAVNLAVSGDSTQHVLWRLEHGEADGLMPDNIVLMIGTNNTWHDGVASANAVAEGIEAVAYSLHARMPKAKVLVLGILPSGVSAQKSAKDAEINRMVATAFAGVKWAATLDLGALFLKPDGSLDATLFYDVKFTPPGKAVHPNTAGQRKWAEAVAAALYGRPQSTTPTSHGR
jgi:lysophospholipase L1-like esterase